VRQVRQVSPVGFDDDDSFNPIDDKLRELQSMHNLGTLLSKQGVTDAKDLLQEHKVRKSHEMQRAVAEGANGQAEEMVSHMTARAEAKNRKRAQKWRVVHQERIQKKISLTAKENIHKAVVADEVAMAKRHKEQDHKEVLRESAAAKADEKRQKHVVRAAKAIRDATSSPHPVEEVDVHRKAAISRLLGLTHEVHRKRKAKKMAKKKAQQAAKAAPVKAAKAKPKAVDGATKLIMSWANQRRVAAKAETKKRKHAMKRLEFRDVKRTAIRNKAQERAHKLLHQFDHPAPSRAQVEAAQRRAKKQKRLAALRKKEERSSKRKADAAALMQRFQAQRLAAQKRAEEKSAKVKKAYAKKQAAAKRQQATKRANQLLMGIRSAVESTMQEDLSEARGKTRAKKLARAKRRTAEKGLKKKQAAQKLLSNLRNAKQFQEDAGYVPPSVKNGLMSHHVHEISHKVHLKRAAKKMAQRRKHVEVSAKTVAKAKQSEKGEKNHAAKAADRASDILGALNRKFAFPVLLKSKKKHTHILRASAAPRILHASAAPAKEPVKEVSTLEVHATLPKPSHHQVLHASPASAPHVAEVAVHTSVHKNSTKSTKLSRAKKTAARMLKDMKKRVQKDQQKVKKAGQSTYTAGQIHAAQQAAKMAGQAQDVERGASAVSGLAHQALLRGHEQAKTLVAKTNASLAVGGSYHIKAKKSATMLAVASSNKPSSSISQSAIDTSKKMLKDMKKRAQKDQKKAKHVKADYTPAQIGEAKEAAKLAGEAYDQERGVTAVSGLANKDLLHANNQAKNLVAKMKANLAVTKPKKVSKKKQSTLTTQDTKVHNVKITPKIISKVVKKTDKKMLKEMKKRVIRAQKKVKKAGKAKISPAEMSAAKKAAKLSGEAYDQERGSDAVSGLATKALRRGDEKAKTAVAKMKAKLAVGPKPSVAAKSATMLGALTEHLLSVNAPEQHVELAPVAEVAVDESVHTTSKGASSKGSSIVSKDAKKTADKMLKDMKKRAQKDQKKAKHVKADYTPAQIGEAKEAAKLSGEAYDQERGVTAVSGLANKVLRRGDETAKTLVAKMKANLAVTKPKKASKTKTKKASKTAAKKPKVAVLSSVSSDMASKSKAKEIVSKDAKKTADKMLKKRAQKDQKKAKHVKAKFTHSQIHQSQQAAQVAGEAEGEEIDSAATSKKSMKELRHGGEQAATIVAKMKAKLALTKAKKASKTKVKKASKTAAKKKTAVVLSSVSVDVASKVAVKEPKTKKVAVKKVAVKKAAMKKVAAKKPDAVKKAAVKKAPVVVAAPAGMQGLDQEALLRLAAMAQAELQRRGASKKDAPAEHVKAVAHATAKKAVVKAAHVTVKKAAAHVAAKKPVVKAAHVAAKKPVVKVAAHVEAKKAVVKAAAHVAAKKPAVKAAQVAAKKPVVKAAAHVEAKKAVPAHHVKAAAHVAAKQDSFSLSTIDHMERVIEGKTKDALQAVVPEDTVEAEEVPEVKEVTAEDTPAKDTPDHVDFFADAAAQDEESEAEAEAEAESDTETEEGETVEDETEEGETEEGEEGEAEESEGEEGDSEEEHKEALQPVKKVAVSKPVAKKAAVSKPVVKKAAAKKPVAVRKAAVKQAPVEEHKMAKHEVQKPKKKLSDVEEMRAMIKGSILSALGGLVSKH
jgi:hypothetical protein